MCVRERERAVVSWYSELRATTLQAAMWNSSRERERWSEKAAIREAMIHLSSLFNRLSCESPTH